MTKAAGRTGADTAPQASTWLPSVLGLLLVLLLMLPVMPIWLVWAICRRRPARPR